MNRNTSKRGLVVFQFVFKVWQEGTVGINWDYSLHFRNACTLTEQFCVLHYIAIVWILEHNLLKEHNLILSDDRYTVKQ